MDKLEKIKLKLFIDDKEITEISIKKEHFNSGHHNKSNIIRVISERISPYIEDILKKE